MRNRCNNPNATKYSRYGGRGISICTEWDNFEVFERWAFANGYELGLTLDRINNNGDYCPANCRWVNNKIQSNNRSNNYIIDYNGTTQNLQQWCDELGLPYTAIYARLRIGWSFDKAVSTPITRAKEYSYGGYTLTLEEWSYLIGIDKYTLYKRLQFGKPLCTVFKELNKEDFLYESNEGNV
jgi:hypothetical protein